MAQGGCEAQVVHGYWCDYPVKLRKAIETPFGSKVTVLRVCVDIQYSVVGREIALRCVQLSERGSGNLGGMFVNVAAKHTGEAWAETEICPEQDLIEAVERDLASPNCRLRRMMLAEWRGPLEGRNALDLGGARDPSPRPECLTALTKARESQCDVTFMYTKPGGIPEIRQVSVRGVWRGILHALDRKDGKLKDFRLDRITDVRQV